MHKNYVQCECWKSVMKIDLFEWNKYKSTANGIYICLDVVCVHTVYNIASYCFAMLCSMQA